jgi:proteasome lid subunit RPN8/RPN11
VGNKPPRFRAPSTRDDKTTQDWASHWQAMIEIHEVLLARICVSAEKSYPNECCGLLLGTSHYIKEIRPVENSSSDSQRRRYLIKPKDLMDADHYGLGLAMDLIGVYHSHPDHPARPSAFDRETAVPQYLYLIVNVTQGRAGDVTCWRMRNWGSEFEPEALYILR